MCLRREDPSLRPADALLQYGAGAGILRAAAANRLAAHRPRGLPRHHPAGADALRARARDREPQARRRRGRCHRVCGDRADAGQGQGLRPRADQAHGGCFGPARHHGGDRVRRCAHAARCREDRHRRALEQDHGQADGELHGGERLRGRQQRGRRIRGRESSSAAPVPRPPTSSAAGPTDRTRTPSSCRAAIGRR